MATTTEVIYRNGTSLPDGSIHFKGETYYWRPIKKQQRQQSKRFFIVGYCMTEKDKCNKCQSTASYIIEDRRTFESSYFCDQCLSNLENRIDRDIRLEDEQCSIM